MSKVIHHAIVVTSWNPDLILDTHVKAMELFSSTASVVSPLLGPTTNGYLSFMVSPDGSKEGWPESKAGDEARAAFCLWLNQQKYGDGSSPLEWFVAEYGSSADKVSIVAHTCDLDPS